MHGTLAGCLVTTTTTAATANMQCSTMLLLSFAGGCPSVQLGTCCTVLRANACRYPAPFLSDEAAADTVATSGAAVLGTPRRRYGTREKEIRRIFSGSVRFDTLWEAQQNWEKHSRYVPCKYFCGVCVRPPSPLPPPPHPPCPRRGGSGWL